jgi:hypothetical protein
VRDDVHRRVVVVVEGAEADELAALGAQREVRADELDQVGRVQHLLSVVHARVRSHAFHTNGTAATRRTRPARLHTLDLS